MKIIKYTYKFKLNPTQEQQVLLNKHFGSVRFIYNYFLNQRKDEYLNNKKSITYNQQSKNLTELKTNIETEWLKEVNSQTLQYSLKCLDQAYQNFFNKRTKFPKFKSRKTKNSFTCPQFVKYKENKLIIPKFQEGIEMIMERKIKGKIKKATISKTPTGKYFVSILTEMKYQPVAQIGKSVGIDLGLKDFIVMSDGTKIKNHQFLKHYEKQLKINQKHLSRKVKNSKRYEKQRLKVARIHEKITNSRMDLIHKITLDLVKKFDIIYLENLNIKGMIKNHKLAKTISDVSWGKFIDILEYKAKWNNKQVIHIDRFFPSSKTCHKCGWINNNLKLSDREWICPHCQAKLDRDINAAINILNEGCRLKINSVGTTDYEHRAEIRPKFLGTSDEMFKKMELIVPETHQSLADV